MSNDVFPTLPGITLEVSKEPNFSTGVQQSVSLRELRASYASAPVWHFTMKAEVLRNDVTNNEVQSLAGFYLSHLGKWDSWLFRDPNDYSVTAQRFGTGNGSGTTFQLVRSFGTFNEPVANYGNAAISVAGNLKTAGVDYNISTAGLVTFTAAPASNAALTWTGDFYFRCRWQEDNLPLRQFMYGLFEADIEFTGSLGTQI